MRTLLCLALALCAWLAAAKPIMVPTGKLTPIMPRLPTPPPPAPYPPLPPAPVWEDPEPGFTGNSNSLLGYSPFVPRRTIKYGYRFKPIQAFIPASSYNKGVIYSYV